MRRHPRLTQGSTTIEHRPFFVMPAHNESAKIGQVVAELRGQYADVVVVDDGSCDATSERALAAGATVLRHPLNRGQGAAIQTGIRYCLERGAECLVTFDSDGQHRPEDVPGLIGPIYRGEADVVLGSRFLGRAREMPWHRRILLRCAIFFTWMVSGVRLTDAHNGLRAFSRRAAEKIDLQLDRMAHASELIDQIRRMGFAFVEVPVEIRYTEYSRAKGQRSTGALKIVLDYLFARLFR